jgi:hypothetical protein
MDMNCRLVVIVCASLLWLFCSCNSRSGALIVTHDRASESDFDRYDPDVGDGARDAGVLEMDCNPSVRDVDLSGA